MVVNVCLRLLGFLNADMRLSYPPGIVPAPFFTTAMQVASRLFLMWAVCYPFPELNGSAWYSSMLLAWSTTEVIRYSYFALKQFDAVPGWLHWLRYSAFLILYPIGISSEVAMTLKALFGPAAELAWWYPYALAAVLLSYIPGGWIFWFPGTIFYT
jgi:very-long-chain (3R)-3-hydroxyacyl-CoA dehydratase